MNMKIRFKINEKILIDIPQERRFHLSPEWNLKFRNVTHQRVDDKPRGFWYAVGDECIHYLKRTSNNYVEEYLYELQINPNSVLILNTEEKVLNFTKQYSISKYGFEASDINWPKVAENFSGIEISPFFRDLSKNLSWYSTWGIASGCIWNQNGLKSIELFSDNWRDLGDK